MTIFEETKLFRTPQKKKTFYRCTSMGSLNFVSDVTKNISLLNKKKKNRFGMLLDILFANFFF